MCGRLCCTAHPKTLSKIVSTETIRFLHHFSPRLIEQRNANDTAYPLVVLGLIYARTNGFPCASLILQHKLLN